MPGSSTASVPVPNRSRSCNISKTGWNAKPLAEALLQSKGVATLGGPDFGVHGEGFLRLSYANSRENIARALRLMAEFLDAEKPTA